MNDYWNNLTNRERIMIMVMGALAMLVLGYFLIIRPLATYVADSERTLASAKASYARIATGAAEVKAAKRQDTAASQTSDVPLRVAVSRVARDNSVAISRIQPGEDGGLTVWVESVPSPQMYRWVHQLAQVHGIAPAKVIAQKSTAEGRLRVQLQFEAAS